MPLDEFGREVLDPTPVELPARLRKFDQASYVRDLVRQELSRLANDEGFETFEEADDFEVEDDIPEFHSPYEAIFDFPVEFDSPVEEGTNNNVHTKNVDNRQMDIEDVTHPPQNTVGSLMPTGTGDSNVPEK